MRGCPLEPIGVKMSLILRLAQCWRSSVNPSRLIVTYFKTARPVVETVAAMPQPHSDLEGVRGAIVPHPDRSYRGCYGAPRPNPALDVRRLPVPDQRCR